MKLSAILAPLLDQKADHETIRAVILAYEAERADALERRRESDRERQSRLRKSRESRDSHVSHSDRSLVRGGDARVEDKTSNSEIEPHKQNNKRAQSALVGFDEWYAHYPHKVQRGAAERAFPKALALAGSVEALIEGVRRYVASKPPDRAWQNPATWLNGKGWLDAPAAVTPFARGSPPQRSNPLSDAFGMMRGHDDRPTEPVSDSVRYLPAASR